MPNFKLNFFLFRLFILWKFYWLKLIYIFFWSLKIRFILLKLCGQYYLQTIYSKFKIQDINFRLNYKIYSLHFRPGLNYPLALKIWSINTLCFDTISNRSKKSKKNDKLGYKTSLKRIDVSYYSTSQYISSL